jgi:hypothetical protein
MRRANWACISGLFQFRHGQSPQSVSDWETVRRPADDSFARNPRLARYVAHEIEIHRVACGRYFGPLRFEQFQTVPFQPPFSFSLRRIITRN